MLADGSVPRRGELRLAGGLVCYRPYRCADGYVTLGALEPKFWAEFCRGVGREDLLEHAFDPPGLGRAPRGLRDLRRRARGSSGSAFASEHDCCLEPVLGLDEALESELVAAREMVVELDQPGAERPVRLLGVPVKLSRTPADSGARAGSRPRRAHPRGARRGRLLARGDRCAARVRRGRRDRRRTPCRARSWRERDVAAAATGYLKISELAERSGVSAGTIKHYLREGLLGSEDEVVRTSRNMAYYPPKFVERIQLIKRLQEERFMPLRVIRELIGSDPERAARMIELEDRILERAIEARETGRDLAREGARDLRPPAERARPARAARRARRRAGAATTTTTSRSSRRSPAFAPAGTRRRSGSPCTTRSATARRSSRWSRRRSGCCSTGSPARSTSTARSQIISSGAEPLRELIGAMHSKLLLAALRRQRGLVSYTD